MNEILEHQWLLFAAAWLAIAVLCFGTHQFAAGSACMATANVWLAANWVRSALARDRANR